MRKIVLLLFPFLIIFGCRKIDYTLADVETYVADYPDSAFQVLNSIPREDLCSARQRADHAILMSMALDKLHYHFENDSIISPAVAYYANSSRNKTKRMLTSYYQGVVLKQTNQLQDAAVCFLQAEELARELKDFFYMGLSERSLNYIYSALYNEARSEDYSIKAYDSFCKAGKKKHARWVLRNLALVYNNQTDLVRSDSVFRVVFRLAINENDPVLYSQLLRAYTSVLVNANTHDKYFAAVDTFHRYQQTSSAIIDQRLACDMAVAFDYVGQRDSSQIYLEEAKSRTQTKIDSALLAFSMERIYENRRLYKEAYEHLKTATSLQNSIVNESLKQSLDNALLQHVSSKKDLAVQKAKASRFALLLILLLSLIVITCLVYLILLAVRHVREAALREERYRQQLREVKDEIVLLSNRLEQASSADNPLFKLRISGFDRLVETYRQSKDTPLRIDDIAFEIEEYISDVRKRKKAFHEIEAAVNASRDSVLIKVKEEVPSLTNEEYQLFVLCCAGFSSSFMSLVFQVPLNMIYDRRYKLKRKLARSGAVSADYFVSLIG